MSKVYFSFLNLASEFVIIQLANVIDSIYSVVIDVVLRVRAYTFSTFILGTDIVLFSWFAERPQIQF